MAMNKWRLDAWAVRDGAAFASRRNSDSLDAENTVFIAVPDLEPVPVGRLSTALSATRRNFQDGFRDTEGNEIAFDNLDQVVELVRRGFLAGGLGPNGSGAPTRGGGPEPGGDKSGQAVIDPSIDDRPESDGARHFENRIKTTGTREWQWREGPGGVKEALESIAEAAETTKQSGYHRTIASLLLLIHAYAESITIDWERRAEQLGDPFEIKMLMDWYQALGEAGVWSAGAGISKFFHDHECRLGLRLLHKGWIRPREFWHSAMTAEASTLPRQHMISYAPCPCRRDWVVGLSRLAEKMTLPMCVGNYFEGNPYLPELAPAALGAILLTSCGFPSVLAGEVQFENARLAVALRWIAHEIPRIALPSVAEGLLNEYAWRQFEGPRSVFELYRRAHEENRFSSNAEPFEKSK